MPYARRVEVGRVCLINFGPDFGKLCTIIDVVDENRAVVDSPKDEVHRQAINFKRLQLTDIKLDMQRGARMKQLAAAWTAAEVTKGKAEWKTNVAALTKCTASKGKDVCKKVKDTSATPKDVDAFCATATLKQTAESASYCIDATLCGKTTTVTYKTLLAASDKASITTLCKQDAATLLKTINAAAKAGACGTAKCAKKGTVVQKCCKLVYTGITHDAFLTCADPANDKKTVDSTEAGTLNAVKVTYTCSAMNLVATAALSAAAVAFSI